MGKIGLLTREEEQDLGRRIRNGDTEARNELVMRNEGYMHALVRSKARKSKHIGIEEFVSAGYFGLIQAADRFDPERGTKFITYAKQWILEEIQNLLAEHASIFNISASTFGRYLHGTGNQFIENAVNGCVSLDQGDIGHYIAGSDYGMEREDTLLNEFDKLVDGYIKKGSVTERNGRIIKARARGLSYEKIGKNFNLTTQRVHYILNINSEKMRDEIFTLLHENN